MGNWASGLLDALGFGNVDRRILLVGLDAAGKTTVLYKLKLGDTVRNIDIIGIGLVLAFKISIA